VSAWAAAGLVAAGAAWAARGRSSSVFGRSVWHGDRRRKAIALTFDDGPSESTPEVLAVLREYKARATFFQCGAHVERLGEIAREVSRAGHEIGNHTHTHPRLWLKAPGFVIGEVGRAQEALVKAHGVAPRLFRAPYGVRWFGVREAQRRFGLTGVMWTRLGRDWSSRAEAIAERILAGCGNGAILCLHDGREMRERPDIRETVEAVRRLVPALMERGYHMETVSEILCPTI
jgi:peptidoglycan/xylan/chitin deacetylase (PgdA/CDA1 family)